MFSHPRRLSIALKLVSPWSFKFTLVSPASHEYTNAALFQAPASTGGMLNTNAASTDRNRSFVMRSAIDWKVLHAAQYIEDMGSVPLFICCTLMQTFGVQFINWTSRVTGRFGIYYLLTSGEHEREKRSR